MAARSRYRMLVIAAGTSLCLATTPAASGGPANMLGHGLVRCGDFIPYPIDYDYQRQIFAGVGGFLSGRNYASIIDRDTYHDLSTIAPVTTIQALVNFCRREPNKLLVEGVDAMLPGLQKTGVV